MSVKTFAIKILNKPSSGYYSAGQVVHGILHIVIEEECKTKGIKLQFSGKEGVKFRVGDHHYVGKREYFNVTIFSLGDGATKLILPVGKRKIPFRFRLPRGLISSFDGKYGEIFYVLEAVMERSWTFNETSQAGLLVKGILELDRLPQTIEPFEWRHSKTVGFFCWKSGTISFKVMLPKRGFIPGESINYLVELTNHSHKPVTRTCIKLIQKVSYHVKGTVRITSQCFWAADGPTIHAGESVVQMGGTDARIPQCGVPPTRATAANLVSCRYFLKIVMNIEGFSLPLKGEVEIIVGTVPFSTWSSSQTSALPVGLGDNCNSDQQPLIDPSEEEPADIRPHDLSPLSQDEAVRQCT